MSSSPVPRTLRGSDAIFAAILSARCAASLSRRAARWRGNGWKFFSLAAFEWSACGWPTRLPLVAPASCLRSSGGVHAPDGCHTRTSMSARWLSPTVGLSSRSERRPITHFRPFWLRWNVHSVFRRVVESLTSVTRNARRLRWNINSKKFRQLERVFVNATSLVGGRLKTMIEFDLVHVDPLDGTRPSRIFHELAH